jgi:protein-disulfide isomerase
MKRYLPFVIVAAVALLAAGAGAMLYRAKVRASAGGNSTVAGAPANAAEQLLHTRGDVAAPVTLEEFGDFQCPSCATVSGIIGRLESEYGHSLRVIFREYPLTMHAHAMEAALAAEAAGLQGRFWEMHDLLYKNQDAWSNAPEVRTIFAGYARSLRLDEERFVKDLNSNEVRNRVFWEGQQGVSRGVQSTPTLFVNGRRLELPFTETHLRAEINAALGGSKSF